MIEQMFKQGIINESVKTMMLFDIDMKNISQTTINYTLSNFTIDVLSHL